MKNKKTEIFKKTMNESYDKHMALDDEEFVLYLVGFQMKILKATANLITHSYQLNPKENRKFRKALQDWVKEIMNENPNNSQ